MAKAILLYVSPEGRDDASGRHPDPAAGKTGPVRTFERAAERVREARGRGRPVTVLVRGGLYPLKKTVVLGPEDSGTPEAPVTWRHYPGEQPVIRAGRAKGSGLLFSY